MKYMPHVIWTIIGAAVFILILSLILGLFRGVHASDRTITVGSLTSAYQSQMKALDAQVATEKAACSVPKQTQIAFGGNLCLGVGGAEKLKAQRITETYQFMLSALQ